MFSKFIRSFIIVVHHKLINRCKDENAEEDEEQGIHRRIEHLEDIRKILSGSCLPDKWEEEDTAEMLVMMESALVNADEEQKVQVVQEIGSVMQVFFL